MKYSIDGIYSKVLPMDAHHLLCPFLSHPTRSPVDEREQHYLNNSNNSHLLFLVPSDLFTLHLISEHFISQHHLLVVFEALHFIQLFFSLSIPLTTLSACLVDVAREASSCLSSILVACACSTSDLSDLVGKNSLYRTVQTRDHARRCWFFAETRCHPTLIFQMRCFS